jgi:hypothetical protein
MRRLYFANGLRSITSAGRKVRVPIVDGTLNECIRSLMAKPVLIRHLYEVHTLPQPPLVEPVLSGEILAELARLKDFSDIRNQPADRRLILS